MELCLLEWHHTLRKKPTILRYISNFFFCNMDSFFDFIFLAPIPVALHFRLQMNMKYMPYSRQLHFCKHWGTFDNMLWLGSLRKLSQCLHSSKLTAFFFFFLHVLWKSTTLDSFYLNTKQTNSKTIYKQYIKTTIIKQLNSSHTSNCGKVLVFN